MKWIFLLLPSILFGKIYDCFPFFNELDILEIRLDEMYEHVDHFVLVEAIETFRGDPKPLHYENNKERFEKYADKIIHVVNPHRHQVDNHWSRERFQRNYIREALKTCARDDIIFLSDVDEIIRKEQILPLSERVSYTQKPITCRQELYKFSLNQIDTSHIWHGTIAFPYRLLSQRRTLEGFRYFRYSLEVFEDAGWHFTSIGTIENHLLKIGAFSHSEIDTPEYKENLRSMMESYPLVPIDETFPRIIQENEEKYRSMGFIK